VLAFAVPKGFWLRARLGPHVDSKRPDARRRSRNHRLALAASLFSVTEKTLGHWRFWQRLQRKLERADIPLRTVEFAYIMIGSALLIGVVTAASGLGTVYVLAAMGVGASLPYGFVAFKGRRRLKAFENQLPDLLVTMAASLKAGHSFRQGMQTVVDEGADPASREFKRVLTETQLGRPMEQSLSEMAERIGSNNFDFVINAVNIQRQVGGSLAGLFDMVADTVRNRQQFQRKVKGLTAMGRASAYVLIALPFAVAGMISLVNAEYMSPLFNTSTGHKLILATLGMMAFGSVILKKIVSFRS
jgi:tight adherence protein B